MPTSGTPIEWRVGTLADANDLLSRYHYLGPVKSGGARIVIVGMRDDKAVCAQVWRHPTSRRLPPDGWLELSRWCLGPDAGPNAGSMNHRAAVRLLRPLGATTLVSYSDPSHGHTGALYRACNWLWAPTWQRLRPPPTGAGNWGTDRRQNVKDRWVFNLARDDRRGAVLLIEDNGAIRHWLRSQPWRAEVERASRSPAPDLAAAARRALADPAYTGPRGKSPSRAEGMHHAN